MRKTLLLCLILQLTLIICPAQLKLIEKTLTELHITSNSLSQVVRQPDGKLVVLGHIASGRVFKTALLRFDSTGVLDNTFGKNGIDTFVTNKLAPAYEAVSSNALALQGDKILIGGGAYFYSGVSQGNTVVARFTSNGTLDSAFGKNGVVISNTTSNSGISIDEIASLAVDAANRIVFAGRTYDYQKYRFIVGRYTANGQFDNTFYGGGINVFDIGTEDDEALDIKVRTGNRLLVMGKTYTNRTKYEVSLLALKANGTKDSSFGFNGVRVSSVSAGDDVAYKMALQPDNKILCVGNSGNSVMVLRYKPNGNADSSFGTNGKVITDIASPQCQVNSVLLQQAGGIVISGYAMKDSVTHFFAMRLLQNGVVDSSFANKGYLYKKIFGVADNAYAACLLPGDRFIQAGQVSRNAASLFGLVQYTPNGTADAGFGNNGIKAFSVGGSRDVAFKMLKAPWDNSFLLCGTANDNWSLVKYKPNKSLQVDNSFGGNGVVAVPYAYEGDQYAEPCVAVDSANKKIYMSGQVGTKVYIFKFNSDGTPDNSFGTKGIVQYPNVYIYYGGLGVLPNGDIVFSALRAFNEGGDYFAAMLRPDGTAETHFGTNGEVHGLPLNVSDVYVDKSNRTIKLGGTVVYDQAFSQAVCIYSMKFNGKTDADYGQNGLAELIRENASANFYKYLLFKDAYGRMLLSGVIQTYDNFSYSAMLSRFTPKGTPDTHFGDGGMVITGVTNLYQNNPANEGIAAGGLDATHGFIVNAGTVIDSYYKTASSYIIGLKNDGTPDNFTPEGSFFNKRVFGGTYESIYAMMMDSVRPNGYTLYVAGTGGRDGLDFGLAKYERYTPVVRDTSFTPGPETNNIGAIYPNPAHSQVTVTYSSLNYGKITVRLLDLHGKLIKQYTFTNAGKNWFTRTLQLPDGMAAGIYFLQVSDGQHIFTAKLVKE